MREVPSGERKPVYPTNLDVIEWQGKEFQVIAMVQSGHKDEDIYLLRDTDIEKGSESDLLIRVKGARFQPAKESKEPKGNWVHRGDEGVKNTGTLIGGKLWEGEDS